MRFIPVEQLEQEGYGEYLSLFGQDGGRYLQESRFVRSCHVRGWLFLGHGRTDPQIPGVLDTTVGYTGGTVPNPSYERICRGDTGHAEAVEIVFDPQKVSYEALLEWFFRMHDPSTVNRQGHDIGTQYRSAIFYHSDAQRETAEKVKAMVDASGRWRSKVVTEIVSAQPFYAGEDIIRIILQKHVGGYSCHYVRPWTYSEGVAAAPKSNPSSRHQRSVGAILCHDIFNTLALGDIFYCMLNFRPYDLDARTMTAYNARFLTTQSPNILLRTPGVGPLVIGRRSSLTMYGVCL